MDRVEKPWGYEIRFICTERFAGKLLFIKAGSQLSLQYHEKKEEAFLVHEGSLELVLGQGSALRVESLKKGQSWHIKPGTVHRFRAITDCTLFEVSTPELDDVVRIEDDFGREGTRDA
jgi:mannose-6-phosphate isomerase-like protein (cupin superfamily)